MNGSRIPATRPDTLATAAQQRLGAALLRLEASPREKAEPDAVRLQAESDLDDEAFDRALVELYLAGVVSYANESGVIGRLAAAVFGDETTYRLTPRGRAALARGTVDHAPRGNEGGDRARKPGRVALSDPPPALSGHSGRQGDSR